MPNTFKKVIDRLTWVQIPPSPNAHAAGMAMCSDLRNDASRNPYVYQLASATVYNRFNIESKSWNFVGTPTLSGTFGAGATMAFAPALAYVGTISAGATTTSVTVSALNAAVGQNSLAARGGTGAKGVKLRVIDYTAGKTAERFIVANSAGSTPLINVDSSFGFTPATNARYEMLDGRIFFLNAGTTGSQIWKSLQVSSPNLIPNLSTTNLPATIGTDSDILVLDEQYTPYDCKPGEGMIKGAYLYDTGLYALVATASGASSLTGQAASGDAGVLANEYRNFQIRIVEDTVTPTAVGQRRIIASHTAGPSAVYTLGSNWTVTPSSSAKFVIELPNLLLLRSSATGTVYTWNYNDQTITNGTNSINANAWSTTYFAASGINNGVGCMWMPSWGIRPDVAKNARHSHCYFWRGGNLSNIDLFDISNTITGTWTTGITYDGSPNMNANTGSCGCYAPSQHEGRMFYINLYIASSINQIFRFDVQNRIIAPFTPTDQVQAGTAAVGKRMVAYAAIDGTDVYNVILLQNHATNFCQELIPLV